MGAALLSAHIYKANYKKKKHTKKRSYVQESFIVKFFFFLSNFYAERVTGQKIAQGCGGQHVCLCGSGFKSGLSAFPCGLMWVFSAIPTSTHIPKASMLGSRNNWLSIGGNVSAKSCFVFLWMCHVIGWPTQTTQSQPGWAATLMRARTIKMDGGRELEKILSASINNWNWKEKL